MKRQRRRFSLAWLGGVVLVGASLVGADRAFHFVQPLPAQAVGSPATGTPSLVATGYVDVPDGVAKLYSLVPGRVQHVGVREAQTVKAGAVLLRLDDRLPRLHVQEATAAVEAADAKLAEARKLPAQHQTQLEQQQAAVEAAEQRLQQARDVLARKQDLVKAEQLSSREADAATAAVKALEAAVRAEKGKLAELKLADPAPAIRQAEAGVAAQKVKLREAQREVEECLLRAPVDGTVLRVLVQEGEVLSTTPKEPALQFCPAGPRIVRAEVEQEFAGRLSPGQAARVQDDTRASGPTWHGKVTRISDWYTQRRAMIQEPRQYNDVRTLECIVTLDPGQPPLRIGQRVRVLVGSN